MPIQFCPFCSSKIETLLLDWTENGSYEYQARVNGKFLGLISQSPEHPDLMNPGKWDTIWKTKTGDLKSSDKVFDTPDEAKQEWFDGWSTSYVLTGGEGRIIITDSEF